MLDRDFCKRMKWRLGKYGLLGERATALPYMLLGDTIFCSRYYTWQNEYKKLRKKYKEIRVHALNGWCIGEMLPRYLEVAKV